ncbi:MAG: hypothetical protein MPEBLZ_03683 [Candidatus Methanoperedens nitroreducens]|uniref:HepT-like domain-containing protein n=1 Tax=Candidatus Methanoperedens nitratireducens TaxID=1392998 RepID=A0A0P8CGE7_9EURY|nr:MAG: hypothetical protein MPEBLZ_03683 [Candidatus Methanoperedens sp. BLZ1]
MDDLHRRILAEKENVEMALSNLNETMARNPKTFIELAAIGTFLHNIYNGIENILKQTLKSRNIEIPKSGSWHKDLLEISVSQGIISELLSDQLYEYLTFRHFFVHAYGFQLEESHLEVLANNIPDIWLKYLHEIDDFLGD